MSDIMQISGSLEDLKVKPNRTIWAKFVSQENVPDAAISYLSTAVGKLGWLSFSVERRLDISDLANLPEVEDNRKTPSQKLREKLWVVWKEKGVGGDFKDYYAERMDRIISAIDEELT